MELTLFRPVRIDDDWSDGHIELGLAWWTNGGRHDLYDDGSVLWYTYLHIFLLFWELEILLNWGKLRWTVGVASRGGAR